MTPLYTTALRFFALFLLLFFGNIDRAAAQCAPGEVSFYMVIRTDSWPYETYWQLAQGVQACTGTFIAEGSNLNVGCDGTASDNSPEGYAGDASITTPVFCLQQDSTYTLEFIDTYGDGGLTFDVYQNGLLTNVWTGQGFGSQWTFVAGVSDLPAYDSPCGALLVEENGAPVSMNNSTAVATVGEVHPPALDCSVYGNWCEGAVTNTVWAKFIPQTAGTYEISTCNEGNGVDSQLAVWKATDCSDYYTYVLITANDDAVGGCNAGDYYSSTAYVNCLEVGTEYLIQIDGWGGATGDIVLTVQSVVQTPTLQANVSDVPCPVDKGQSGTGSILAYITGSSANWSASWQGPNGFTSDAQSLIDVQAGSYELTATDVCGNTYSEIFEIIIPEFWNLSLDAVRPTCDGSTDGSLSITVSGGTAPYNYAWTGDAQSGFPSIDNLGVGSYTFTVTDQNECTYTQTYAVTALNSFTVDLGADTTLCLNQTLLLTAPDGMQYQWQDGSTAGAQTVSAATLGVGIYQYQVTVSSPEGCVAVDDVQITVDNCVGVEELAVAQPAGLGQVTVFPNPLEQGSVVRWSNTLDQLQLTVFDAAGRSIYTEQVRHTQQWNYGGQFVSGCYVLTLTSNSERVSLPMVVK